MPNPGDDYDLNAARQVFGEDFVGAVEIAADGTARVAAGTYAAHGSHRGVAQALWGSVPQGKRFGFTRRPSGAMWVPANTSTGVNVTVADIAAIRNALQSRGFLQGQVLHIIWAFDDIDANGNPVGAARPYNLVTAQPLVKP